MLKPTCKAVVDIFIERFQAIPELLAVQVNELGEPVLLKRAVTIPSLTDFQRLLTEQIK